MQAGEQVRKRPRQRRKAQSRRRRAASVILGTIVIFLVIVLRTEPSSLWLLVEAVVGLTLLFVFLRLHGRRATLKRQQRSRRREAYYRGLSREGRIGSDSLYS